MALRDGAITIYNFYKDVLAIDNNLKGCTKIISLIDKPESERPNIYSKVTFRNVLP
jgi:hypothetical protein